MNIYIYGGSFDPFHNGHLHLIDFLYKRFEKIGDDFSFNIMVSNNPLKNKNEYMFSHCDRFLQVKDALKKYHRINVIMDCFSTSYDMLKSFDNSENSQIHLIIGADNWSNFKNWKNYHEILKNYKIIVLPRNGYAFNNYLSANAEYLNEFSPICVSSTEIRNNFSNNELNLIKGKVPNTTYNLIEKKMKNKENEYTESIHLFKNAFLKLALAVFHSFISCVKYIENKIKENPRIALIAIFLFLLTTLISQIFSFRTKEMNVSKDVMNYKDTIYSLKQDIEFEKEKNIATVQTLRNEINQLKENNININNVKTKRYTNFKHKIKKDTI